MSEENVELARSIPGDLSRLIDVLDEEVILDIRAHYTLPTAKMCTAGRRR